jgi:hypothetical protein
MALAGGKNWAENEAVAFPGWQAALACSGLDADTQRSHEREIIAFLVHCRKHHAPATIILAKDYLRPGTRQGGNMTREALRWFFRAARAVAMPQSIPGGTTLPETAPRVLFRQSNLGPPPLAGADMGRVNWEKDLIVAMRAKGFLWRTEKT